MRRGLRDSSRFQKKQIHLRLRSLRRHKRRVIKKNTSTGEKSESRGPGPYLPALAIKKKPLTNQHVRMLTSIPMEYNISLRHVEEHVARADDLEEAEHFSIRSARPRLRPRADNKNFGHAPVAPFTSDCTEEREDISADTQREKEQRRLPLRNYGYRPCQ